MNFSRIISFALIVFGGFIAFYAQSKDTQNVYLLVGGIILLMIGLYRISRNIPSKFDEPEDDNLNEEE
jgi:sulfite exporter TauE/SafE